MFIDSSSTIICPQRPNWQYASNVSRNGIEPKRQQTWIFKWMTAKFTDAFMSHSLPVTYLIISEIAESGTNVIQYYSDVTISVMTSKITSLTIVYSTVYSGTDLRKHHSSASLAFVMEIRWWSVNSPHRGSVTRKMFPFDDVIINMTHHCRQLGKLYCWIETRLWPSKLHHISHPTDDLWNVH